MVQPIARHAIASRLPDADDETHRNGGYPKDPEADPMRMDIGRSGLFISDCINGFLLEILAIPDITHAGYRSFIAGHVYLHRSYRLVSIAARLSFPALVLQETWIEAGVRSWNKFQTASKSGETRDGVS